jgi:hypothetical protein
MASKFLQRLTLAAVLIGGLGLLDAQSAAAARPVRRTARPEAARGFNLFAGAVNVMMNTNRIQCNINNIGEQCVDPTNSSVVGGGYWPKGTPDQYIFNGGLQVAAIIPGTKATFAWSGDTVGAYFFDARGDQAAGQGLTNVYNSLNATDLAEWPSAAYVNDPTLFNAALLGRKTVSQQDTYVRYWDGNVSLLTGRQHPMGLLVDQRALMWNFPSGNQDIMYFLIRFINITANDASRYAGLSAYGYTGTDIADIVQIARDFRAASSAAFNVALPDTGYAFTNMYAGYGQDPDEGNSGVNYSTGNMPFSMGFVYKANFNEPTWSFPADIFGTPFAPAPGMEGVKYLKSPTDPGTGRPFGITMFTNTTNGGAFTDRFGVQALWRLASNNLQSQDGSCNAPRGTPLCQLVQTYADTRFYMYSGPMTIKPGESAVIVVAMVHAAPVSSAIQVDNVTPQHTLGAQAFDMKPGFPGTVSGYISASSRAGQTGLDTVRQIDRATGWIAPAATVAAQDLNGNGVLEQTEIPTVPRSLLNKSLVAQAVYDAKFLLPFSPEGPPFFLVPGDNKVTIAWQPSATETAGDPYYLVASDPLNSLYDPNFRRYDVEGYRIWRGRTEASMEVIAAFDYTGTTITDHTGGFFYSDNPQCAPELGLAANCPVAFNPNGSGPSNDVPLTGHVVQIPAGGRTKLSDGSVYILNADTAVTGGNSGLPGLTDNGVPFAYIDASARNGFRYFYAVTAFDVNSVNSGPSSLESPLTNKQVTPRAASSNNTPAVLVVGMYGSDTTQLNPNAPFPAMDAATGTFAGILPPTNGGSFGFLASVAEALPPGEYVARIDSVIAGIPASLGDEPHMYMTFSAPGVTSRIDFDVPFPSHGDPDTVKFGAADWSFSASTPLVPYDTVRALALGIPLSFSRTARMPVEFSATFSPISAGPSFTMLCGRGLISAANCGTTLQASRYLLHSRFFDEGGAEPPDPTINFNPSPDHTSGKLTGVTNIWAPFTYRTPLGAGGVTRVPAAFRYYAYGVTGFYPADFVITWGAGGAVTVRDTTHHTDLPYNRALGPGWGFISGAALVAAGVTTATLQIGGNELGAPNPAVPSYHSIYTARPICDGALSASGLVGAGITCVNLSQTAVLQGLDFSNPADGVSDGNGIVMAINGEVFFMNMAALPAAGTKWHFRAIGGPGLSATCTPALPAGTGELLTPPTDCSGYAYNRPVPLRTPMVPGLQYKMIVSQGFENSANSGDLSRIHTVPDPYYVTNSLEITANTKVLRFVNLPDRAIIRIYSVSGILVNVLTHNDATGGGEEVWNLRNRNNQFVASGVYFYHVETPDGQTKIGRFTVVNYAQ